MLTRKDLRVAESEWRTTRNHSLMRTRPRKRKCTIGDLLRRIFG